MSYNFEEVSNKLKEVENIVISSHQSPDGDAIGSSLALWHFLKKIGVSSKIVIPDSIPPFLKWMKGIDEIVVFEGNEELASQLIKEADVFFALDYNEAFRAGKSVGQLIVESNSYKIMIDHHLHPSEMADWMMSDTSVCSTAQLIYEFIEGLNAIEALDPIVAEGIYVGLVTDSGSFRFPSVDARTHEIVAHLMRIGLNHSRVHESLFDVNSLNRLRLMGYSLSEKLKVLPNIPVAVIYLSKAELDRMDNQKGSTEGLVNYALSVEGVKMAAFIKEDIAKVKMSFRSKGDIAVNEFSSKYFQGGGHKNAAGGVSFDSFEETITKFEKVIYDFLD